MALSKPIFAQDFDNDGIDDSTDLDDDNDGILDSYECSATIQFNSASALTASDLNDVQVGEKVMYTNALFYQNQYYDIILTITSISGSFTVDCNNELRVDGFNSGNDDHVTYSFDLVEAGSATPGNPTGTPAFLYNIVLESRDIDTREDDDFTEVAGYNSATLTSTLTPYLSATTNLEQAGFINGPDPTNFVMYRLDPSIAGPINDWVDEPDDGGTQGDDPDFYLFMQFDVFSHVDLLFGATGTDATSTRLTNFGASAVCDDDLDGYLNTVDIDSDNDGIPDNVEAQPTLGYIAPTGAVDGTTGILLVYGTGIIPIDTDGDGRKDLYDLDTDADGLPDIQENGMPNATINIDTDAEGLDDAFEGSNLNDATDVNDEIDIPASSILPDSDGDLSFGGDLDYRDDLANSNPVASIDFDGVDDYVDSDLNFSAVANATIMAWVKLDAGFVASGQIAGFETMRMYVDAAGRLVARYRTSAGGLNSITSINNLDIDQWYHVAISYEGATGQTNMYFNGALERTSNIATGTLSAVALYTTPKFCIGRRSYASNQHFRGAIDEVRVFDTVLTEDQLQCMVYQEIQNNAGNVQGVIIAKNIQDMTTNQSVSWANLRAYYPMTNIVSSRTIDYSGNNLDASLHNITTVQSQTAPMPYETSTDGPWTTAGTWLHGDVWDIGDPSKNKDWCIVNIKNNVSTSTTLRSLGLIIDQGKILDVTGDNEVNNSWYFELNGTLDLADDSQLVQGPKSDLVTSATGNILRRQEGTANVYWYNYWSSPVGALSATSLTDNNTAANNINNSAYTLGMLEDGLGNAIQFTAAQNDLGKVSTNWLYTFSNGVTYYDWSSIGTSSALSTGMGYTQKGTGNAGLTQQYIFEGKPNNGTVLLSAIDTGGPGSVQNSSLTTYLVGNPYPSALDARQFITDNAGVIDGTLLLWEQWAGTTHVTTEYEGGYAYINNLTTERAYQYPGIPIAGQTQINGLKRPSFYIPVGQAFFVEVVSNGNIEFNNGQRLFIKESDGSLTNPSAGSTFFKTGPVDDTTDVPMDPAEEQTQSAYQLIRLELAMSNGSSRSFALGFHENFTDQGREYGFDGGLISNPADDDMGSLLNGDQYVIQALAPITSDKVVDLAFRASGEHTYTIKTSEISNINSDQAVYLHDTILDVYHDLRQEEGYSFSSEEGQFNTRFDVVFRSAATANEEEVVEADVLDVESDMLIYYNDQQEAIIVKGLKEDLKQFNLYNTIGQSIFKLEAVKSETLEQGVNVSALSSGVYIVSLLTTTDQTIDRKIIIE